MTPESYHQKNKNPKSGLFNRLSFIKRSTLWEKHQCSVDFVLLDSAKILEGFAAEYKSKEPRAKLKFQDLGLRQERSVKSRDSSHVRD